MTTRFTSSSAAVRGLVIAFAISSVGFGALEPFLILWGHRAAGLAGSAAGLLFIAQAAGEVCGGLAGGLWADRIGGRQVLLVSTLGMALGYGSLALVGDPALALAVIFVAGLFEATFHPTALALIGELTPEDRRTHMYGVLRMAANVGTILGPVAGAAIVAGVSLTGVFVLSGALLAGAGLVAVVTLPRRGFAVSLRDEAEEIQAAVPGMKAIAGDRRLGLLVAGGALLAITLAWWEADGLALVHTQRSFGTTDFSLILALSAAITVAFQIPVTRLTRDRPIAGLLAAGALLQGIGLASLSAASLGVGVVVGGVVLVAAGQMLYGPNLNALVSTIAPRGRGTTYQAAISTSNDIGMAGGPASGLALGAGIGAGATWALALPLGLVAATATARAAWLSTAGRRAAPDDPDPAAEDVVSVAPSDPELVATATGSDA